MRRGMFKWINFSDSLLLSLLATVICLSGLPAAGSSGACSRNVVCTFSGQAFETEIFRGRVSVPSKWAKLG